MITVNKASRESVQALSKKLLKLLEDKNSQLYQENVAKFGIPEEYVRMAFSEERVLKAADSGKSTFYLALENRGKILGFAQTVESGDEATELDRIVVFPESTRQGLGTRLLDRIVKDLTRKGYRRLVVNAGKDETHAKRFYEKNGFRQVGETSMEAPPGNKIALITYQFELGS